MEKKENSIKQIEEGLRAEYFIKGDKLKSIEESMKETNTPGISVAIIDNFEIAWAKGYGVKDKETQQQVNTSTVFQAASISKPITALAVMKLAQDEKLDLDENINSYLKSWKLPENEFNRQEKVTLRNLMSHTAGVTVHGFDGYKPDSDIPSLLQVLNSHSPANSHKILVNMKPNSEFRYSGGGYTIIQQVLIEQLEKPFEEIMKELVLEPLGMKNSFYTNMPLREEYNNNSATSYYADGSEVTGKRHVYPEMAAAGLWTTAEDLAEFCIEVQKSLKGKSNKIINKEFMKIMTTPVLDGVYNIGLRNSKVGKEEFLGHSGSNEGVSCQMLFHKEKGYGLVLMTNSSKGYEINMPLLRSTAVAYNWENILD